MRTRKTKRSGSAARSSSRSTAGGANICSSEFGLESALELEFDTHYRRFLMPTIRGAEEGSKKRYAGLTVDADGSEEMVYKGLESVRTDWTPLAQQFQQQLYLRIFKREPYQDFVRDYVDRTLAGEFDELLVYRKQLRRRSATISATCRRMCGRRDSPTNSIAGRIGRCNIRTAAGSAT